MSIFDDLDDDDDGPFIPPCPDPDLFIDIAPPTRHKAAWWERSETEYWLTDFPEFSSMMDRGRYMVEGMARRALEALGAGEGSPVLQRRDGTPVTLLELLGEMDELERGALLRSIDPLAPSPSR